MSDRFILAVGLAIFILNLFGVYTFLRIKFNQIPQKSENTSNNKDA